MVNRLGAAVVVGLALGVALGGCFNFKDDLAKCQRERRCPLEDGGYYSDGGALVIPAGGLCSQGVCWENPFPTGVPISSLYAATPDELFVGGGGGVLVHVKGDQAELALLGRPTPPVTDWARVAGLAQCSTGVSAMTADRQLFTFADGGFAARPCPQGLVPSALQGWTGPGPTCAFVGNNGPAAWVAEEVAGQLTTLGSPANTTAEWRRVRGIAGTSRDSLWLATSTDVQTRSADGGFAPDSVPFPDGGLPEVSGVCVAGGGDVFLSTADGIRTRSSSWSRLGDGGALAAIACLPGGDVVATGTGLIRRCDGAGGCSDLTGPEAWQAVTTVGDRVLLGSRTGDLAYLPAAGGALTRLSSGTRADLVDLSISPTGDAWAVGRGATLLHRTDAGWVAVDAGVAAADLFAVRVLSDGRVLVGGAGGVLRVFNTDGSVDKPLLFLANGTLVQNQQLGQDLHCFREMAGRVWAGATRGTLLREEPDGTWKVTPTADIWDIDDMAENDAGVMWLTGGGAGVQQSLPGGGWDLIRGPFAAYAFLTVFPDSKGSVWFGGRDGLAMRLNPDGGQEGFSFPDRTDDVIGFIEQPDGLYAIGQRSLYRYTGVALQWQIVGPLPLDPQVNALQSVGAFGEDFWVVGGGGAILRVNRAQWLRQP